MRSNSQIRIIANNILSILTGLTPKISSVNTISYTVQLFGFKLLCRTRDEAIIKLNVEIEISLDQSF